MLYDEDAPATIPFPQPASLRRPAIVPGSSAPQIADEETRGASSPPELARPPRRDGTLWGTEPPSPAWPAAVDEPPPDCTLSQILETLYLPENPGLRPQTVSEYRMHVRRWEEFGAANPRTLCPGIRSIGKEALLAWRGWLAALRGGRGKALGQRAINKHLAAVRMLLDVAADEGLYHRRPPKLKRLRHAKAAPKHYLCEADLDRLYRACSVARWPAGLHVPAPAFWRAAIVLLCCKGLRTQELVAYESDMRPLLWESIRVSPASPVPWGHCESEFGWLVYVPQKQESVKPDPLVLPLSDVERRHLDSIRSPNADDASLVFPWPKSKVHFYRAVRAIFDAAQIPHALNLKHLRKTCETRVDNHRPGLGEQITGHAARNVSQASYLNFEQRLLECVRTLPHPPAFVEGLDDLPRKQLTLF